MGEHLEEKQGTEYTAEDVLRAVYLVFGREGRQQIEEELRWQVEHRDWRPRTPPEVPQSE